MKGKLLAIIFLLLSLMSLSAGSVTYNMNTFRVKGYVAHILQATLDLDTGALPFDMTGDNVQPVLDSELSTSPGLRIGTWTLFSDYAHVNATFTLTPLTDGVVSFDYYLQFTYPSAYNSTTKKYSYSLYPVASDSTVKTLELDDFGNAFVNIDQGNIYLRMKENAGTVKSKSVSGGQYTSTLTLKVDVND